MADLPLYGYGLESALSLAGLALLWFGRARRWGAATREAPAAILPWPGQMSDLMLYLIFAILGAIILPSLTNMVLLRTPLGLDAREVWTDLAFDVGAILGIWIFYLIHARFHGAPSAPTIGPMRSGAITFLVALPLIFATGFLWRFLLGSVGFEARDQDVVELFQSLHTPALRVLFVFLAVVVAPCAEELVFRAGIFRFLHGRIPRGWAVWISALLFAAMHLIPKPVEGLGSFLQLIVLGAVFALAYERTGRIGTSIVAHALFNLNMLVALLFGVN